MASRGNAGRRQLGVDTTGGFNNHDDTTAMNVAATSPTSSQGSWVVDPDEGWDGLGAVSVPPSPEAARQHLHQRQHEQRQRRLSPASSSLRGWAQVPVSPPAAEYPAMMTTNMPSPPASPGSVRSASSAGSSGSAARAAAGEGLVALARDQNQDQHQNQNQNQTSAQPARPNANLVDVSVSDVAPSSSSSSSSSSSATSTSAATGTSAAGILPRSLAFETFEELETQGFGHGSGGRDAWAGGARAGGGVGFGCTTADDVNAMETTDMDVSDFGEVNPAGEQEHEHEHAFVMRAAPGMTAAEAVEAIAEAAELRGMTPTSVVLSHTQVSPSRPSSAGASPSLSVGQEGKEGHGRGHAQEVMFRCARSPSASYRSMTPPRNPSPSSASARAAGANAAGVPGVPDVDAAAAAAAAAARVAGAGLRAPTGSVGTSTSSSTCIPMDATVGIDVDVDVGVDVDGKYDGKHMDRLWRWTGLITAAKMGVIPIIVCATVAALSTQTGGGGGDRGEGTGGGGGGGGGGGRGGGGSTRSFSRRRPRGGGGGGGCFPDARIDRCGMPMPYCVAPSVACA